MKDSNINKSRVIFENLAWWLLRIETISIVMGSDSLSISWAISMSWQDEGCKLIHTCLLPGPEVMKKNFKLNSAEHEIFPAH